jgi:hypothetical protein
MGHCKHPVRSPSTHLRPSASAQTPEQIPGGCSRAAPSLTKPCKVQSREALGEGRRFAGDVGSKQSQSLRDKVSARGAHSRGKELHGEGLSQRPQKMDMRPPHAPESHDPREEKLRFSVKLGAGDAKGMLDQGGSHPCICGSVT